MLPRNPAVAQPTIEQLADELVAQDVAATRSGKTADRQGKDGRPTKDTRPSKSPRPSKTPRPSKSSPRPKDRPSSDRPFIPPILPPYEVPPVPVRVTPTAPPAAPRGIPIPGVRGWIFLLLIIGVIGLGSQALLSQPLSNTSATPSPTQPGAVAAGTSSPRASAQVKTPAPTPAASAAPTPAPSVAPSPGPTPTAPPSVAPSVAPTPTAKPTAKPTPKPTAKPTAAPTPTPTPKPVVSFLVSPTKVSGDCKSGLKAFPITFDNTGSNVAVDWSISFVQFQGVDWGTASPAKGQAAAGKTDGTTIAPNSAICNNIKTTTSFTLNVSYAGTSTPVVYTVTP
jgi:hypothetical protein